MSTSMLLPPKFMGDLSHLPPQRWHEGREGDTAHPADEGPRTEVLPDGRPARPD